MSDRETLRLDFLKAAGLADAVRAPLPGDASTRRYERLTPTSGATLMLMDQAPAAESQPCDPRWTPEQRHAAGWNAVARLSAGTDRGLRRRRRPSEVSGPVRSRNPGPGRRQRPGRA
jgi:N-acetylmuramate 1-kinase